MKKTKTLTVVQRVRITYENERGLNAAISEINDGVHKLHMDHASNLRTDKFYNAKSYGKAKVVREVKPKQFGYTI